MKSISKGMKNQTGEAGMWYGDVRQLEEEHKALIKVANAAKLLEMVIDGMGIRSSFRDVGPGFENLTDALEALPEGLLEVEDE